MWRGLGSSLRPRFNQMHLAYLVQPRTADTLLAPAGPDSEFIAVARASTRMCATASAPIAPLACVPPRSARSGGHRAVRAKFEFRRFHAPGPEPTPIRHERGSRDGAPPLGSRPTGSPGPSSPQFRRLPGTVAPG